MFAKVLSVLAVAAVVAAYEDYRPYQGVDPNTLQCDPEGQIFLLLPDFHDCSIFYICAHGEEVLQHCPGGTIFDFELQGCAWPYNGKCTLRDEIEGSGDGDYSGSGEPEINEANAELEPEPAASAPVPSFPTFLNCLRPDSAYRQVAFKGDCQRYWRCGPRGLESAYCADGLSFNPSTQQCDHEANVPCALPDDELNGEFIVYK